MARPSDPVSPTAEPRGERALLDAYRRGDRNAAELLVERTYRRVYGALYKFTGGDADLAADLTQETYRRAWQALSRFEGRSRVSTWLYRIAYSTYLNHARRPRPVDPLEPQTVEPSDPEPDPARRAETAAEERRLRAAVLRLAEPLRFTVSAHYWAGLPIAEIARQEAITPVAVRKRLKRSLRLLREALREDDR